MHAHVYYEDVGKKGTNIFLKSWNYNWYWHGYRECMWYEIAYQNDYPGQKYLQFSAHSLWQVRYHHHQQQLLMPCWSQRRMEGISICDFAQIANHLFEASKSATALFVSNLVDNSTFTVKTHLSQVHQLATAMWCKCATKEEAFLTELLSYHCALWNHLDTAKVSGAWLMTILQCLNGMELLPVDFQDTICLQYDKHLLNLDAVNHSCLNTWCHANRAVWSLNGTRWWNRNGLQWLYLHTVRHTLSLVAIQGSPQSTWLPQSHFPFHTTTLVVRPLAIGNAFVDAFWLSNSTWCMHHCCPCFQLHEAPTH